MAALSIVLNQSKVQQQVQTSLTKTAMNQAENQSNDLIKMLEQSVQPHLGNNVNIKRVEPGLLR
ncbi:YjfB family protein [Anaerobacillus sp. 1_MG-2023]|nr:YjfB family protein [Anaerobacillus sp. 1_MG-2023]